MPFSIGNLDILRQTIVLFIYCLECAVEFDTSIIEINGSSNGYSKGTEYTGSFSTLLFRETTFVISCLLFCTSNPF